MSNNEENTGQQPETASGEPFRSGYVAIIGKPNAGKSTLLNALIGQKIAITSDKPQTTRDKIAGIYTTDEFQIVFLDTPGVIVPEDRFNETLIQRAAEALQGSDVIYHLLDSTDRDAMNERLEGILKRVPRKIKRFLVVNKVDKRFPVDRDGKLNLPETINTESYDEIFMVSALKKQGLDHLVKSTVKELKPGPQFYDPEQVSDRDMRFFASEIVREKVFRRTGAEIPYAVYTEVDEYTEREDKDYIRINILCERDSQKGILIGEGGRVLKDIGQDARRAIEAMTDRPCYLELRVKVRKDWRRKEYDLNNFGFKLAKKKRVRHKKPPKTDETPQE